MISYLCNKANKIINRNIKIDITEFEYHKKEITQHVEEKGIANIINDYKQEMDNIPYITIKNLAEILTLYDELENFYEFLEQPSEEDFNKLNKTVKQISFIPKKVKANIINDMSELFKLMTTPGHEIDAREPLIYYREIIIYHFLENEDLKKSLSMMKYYYIKKNNKFVKIQMYCNNDLKKGNFFQYIVYKILKFYYYNQLYFPNKHKIQQPIIGYKNNIPVLNPKFFEYQEKYSFTKNLITNIGNLVTF